MKITFVTMLAASFSLKAPWCSQSPATRLLFNILFNKNVKTALYWPLLCGYQRWSVDSDHKGSVMQKAFPCHDVIMLMLSIEIGIQASITFYLDCQASEHWMVQSFRTNFKRRRVQFENEKSNRFNLRAFTACLWSFRKNSTPYNQLYRCTSN